MSSFGERLKRLRKRKRCYLPTSAEYLGVVSSAAGKYETIENSYPSVECVD